MHVCANIAVAIMKKIFIFCFLFLFVFGITGCSSNFDKKTFIQDSELIYEETISPNREYVESEEDIVDYTIEIYQDNENNIIVYSTSNSEFFDPLQYEIEWEGSIKESDIVVEWTTLMGSQTPSIDDQLAIANVSFLKDGEVLQKIRISFVNQGIEIIKDTIENK